MELEFMSYLALKEAYALEDGDSEHREICRDAQRKFLQDHLGRWVKIFAEILLCSTVNPLYAQVGKLLRLFVASDSRALGVTPREIIGATKIPPPVSGPFSCDACRLVRPQVESQSDENGGGS